MCDHFGGFGMQREYLSLKEKNRCQFITKFIIFGTIYDLIIIKFIYEDLIVYYAPRVRTTHYIPEGNIKFFNTTIVNFVLDFRRKGKCCIFIP